LPIPAVAITVVRDASGKETQLFKEIEENYHKERKVKTMSETYESQSSCSSDCSSCGAECPSRTGGKEDFFVPLNQYSRVKKVIGIVSGKGGVGKSFITSYMSVLMNRKGYKTAILDADITGPSIPKAFGVHSKAQGNEFGIFPAVTKTGIKVMSVNLLLETEDTPVIWRGPVIAGTVKQFWSEVLWEDVDYMFVDMPPGTGDVPLTVFQSLPVDGLIIVTSPQELVSMIVAKAVNMAAAMNIPILGLVENYSYISCGNCGEKISVFGTSHIEENAKKYNLKVLGKLPIDPAIAAAIDGEKVEELSLPWLDTAADILEKEHPVRDTEEVQELDTYKIAVTTDDKNNVFQHFGKSERFTIYEFNKKELISKVTIQNNGKGHEELVVFLANQKVKVLICGGIGKGAMEGLMAAGILVIPGTTGDIDVVVASYLDGSLADGNESTCNHSHEDGEGCKGECHCHEA
jgi:Mrp family chromosome partitioning ATPase/predicted Fe-Mo cluster-binding NifX family protein